MVTPSSPEITIRSEQAADEMRLTQRTIPEIWPETIPQSDRSYDGTHTDHDMQPDADTSVEQLNSTATNHRSSKYDIRHNAEPNCNDDYGYLLCPTTVYETYTYTFRKS